MLSSITNTLCRFLEQAAGSCWLSWLGGQGGTTACQGCGAGRRSSAGLCPPCGARCPGRTLSLSQPLSPAMELPSACSHPGWSVLALGLGLLLWARRRRGWDPRRCPTDLTGKTVIVTGANSGETALVAWGATVLQRLGRGDAGGPDAMRGAGEMQDRGAGLWDPAWPWGLAAGGPPSPAAGLAPVAQMAPGEAGSWSPGCARCAPGASTPCTMLTAGRVPGDLVPTGILCVGAALPRQALGGPCAWTLSPLG